MIKLQKQRYDDIVILKFTGELDTFTLPAIGERMDRMIEAGDRSWILDLYLLKFLNSAALGYLIKTSKTVKTRGGEMVLARPSRFVKKSLVTLGLEDVFKVYDTVENAILHFKKGEDVSQLNLEGNEFDESLTGNVPLLFRTFAGPKDVAPPNQTGRIVTLYSDGLLFRYEPEGKHDVVEKQLVPGVALKLKFRQPFAVKNYFFEIEAKVSEVNALLGGAGDEDRAITVRVKYEKIRDEDRKHLEQFVRDQETWRGGIPG